jgi:hypothetical protein
MWIVGHDNRCAGHQSDYDNNPECYVLHSQTPLRRSPHVKKRIVPKRRQGGLVPCPDNKFGTGRLAHRRCGVLRSEDATSIMVPGRVDVSSTSFRSRRNPGRNERGRQLRRPFEALPLSRPLNAQRTPRPAFYHRGMAVAMPQRRVWSERGVTGDDEAGASRFLLLRPPHLHHPRGARLVHHAGGSMRDVQLLAGHRSIQTTQRYIDGDSDAQRKLVSMI